MSSFTSLAILPRHAPLTACPLGEFQASPGTHSKLYNWQMLLLIIATALLGYVLYDGVTHDRFLLRNGKTYSRTKNSKTYWFSLGLAAVFFACCAALLLIEVIGLLD